jgi:hypothetical protein
MLDDAAIERFSRQILLPEVGGRGQERLCATRAVVQGTGDGADVAATLLEAAGLQIDREDGPRDRVTIVVDRVTVLGGGSGGAAVVATLVGRPCARCLGEEGRDRSESDGLDDASWTQAFGAVVAAEALRAALGLVTSGRLQALDLARGKFAARELQATAGCDACAGAA